MHCLAKYTLLTAVQKRVLYNINSNTTATTVQYSTTTTMCSVFPADVHRHGGVPRGETVPEAADRSGQRERPNNTLY